MGTSAWCRLMRSASHRTSATAHVAPCSCIQAKNSVLESMLPTWLDFVVWGHEHECKILPEVGSESADSPTLAYA